MFIANETIGSRLNNTEMVACKLDIKETNNHVTWDFFAGYNGEVKFDW